MINKCTNGKVHLWLLSKSPKYSKDQATLLTYLNLTRPNLDGQLMQSSFTLEKRLLTRTLKSSLLIQISALVRSQGQLVI